MLAYLVIREGSKWTDVFRLVPGQAVTIGRAPTNQILVKDERCSRNHAEIFFSEGRWVFRDLDSRNGTLIGDARVKGDRTLAPGDLVRIGASQMAFVDDISLAFPESDSPLGMAVASVRAAETASTSGETSEVDGAEPTTITHRRGQTRFLEPDIEAVDGTGKVGPAAAKLCRLAFDLAKAADLESLTKVVLKGLFEGAQADAGGVWLLRRDKLDHPQSSNLELVASRTETTLPYHRVSTFLADTVLREGEAVMARNVVGDSTLGVRDSKGEFHVATVMCAPVRRGNRVLGLIHLYSTSPPRPPDPDDLEFLLAVAETLAVALHNLKRREELTDNLNQIRAENVQLLERLGVESEIVGRSTLLSMVTQQIARAAPTNATVLIRGESGVGKELVARAVHFSSARKKGTFICLNCAALSESLLESELFGHERGAFTGAVQRKIGKFEAADGGTLMLDEIGEMSQTIQAKFLRVLEGHPFERVGGSEAVKADVRVLAATNRDLEKDVTQNRFRRDLYFRLRVLEIYVPPLRKRADDIPELAQFFFDRFNGETGRKLKGFTDRALDQMLAYRWPGNIRELKNVVERAVVIAQADYIDAGDLMLSKLPTTGDTADVIPSTGEFKPVSLSEMERRHILATLRATAWNKSQAASLLGIERSTLDRKIRRYELSPQRVS